MDVPRETRERLDRLSALILDEAQRQNLIAASTVLDFEHRHIEDSLQLLLHMPTGVLIDIGSGAGLPGLALACCRTDPVHLVEPRTKRADFLQRATEELGITDHVRVHCDRIERVMLPAAAVITARAVARLETLFAMASHVADGKTRWVLPKGRTALSELETARRSWQGNFTLAPSSTDAESAIVLAVNVRRRQAR